MDKDVKGKKTKFLLLVHCRLVLQLLQTAHKVQKANKESEKREKDLKELFFAEIQDEEAR